MIEKQIMIPKTVYESTDGIQFDNQYDAEKWDCQAYLNNNMADRYCGIMETGYCLLNSKEEEYGKPTTVVTTNDYNRFKEMAEKFQLLCKMYESVNKL